MPPYMIGRDLWNAYSIFIGRFLFRSGNQEHPGDKIENTTVEILPVSVGRCSYTHRLSHLCSVTCKQFWLRWSILIIVSMTELLDCLRQCGRLLWLTDWLRYSQSAFTSSKFYSSFIVLAFQGPGLQTKEKYKQTDDRFYRIGKWINSRLCVLLFVESQWNIMSSDDATVTVGVWKCVKCSLTTFICFRVFCSDYCHFLISFKLAFASLHCCGSSFIDGPPHQHHHVPCA